jgi:hypothetical protein
MLLSGLVVLQRMSDPGPVHHPTGVQVMALPLSRRCRLEFETLEQRNAPSSTGTLTQLGGSIHLTPSSAAQQPHSGGIMVYSGTATLTSAQTGTMKGTFTETIRPFHAHGHVELTVSGKGDTFAIKLLENYKPQTGSTQASLGLKVTGAANDSGVLGSATGNTNFSNGVANLTFSTSLVRL